MVRRRDDWTDPGFRVDLDSIFDEVRTGNKETQKELSSLTERTAIMETKIDHIYPLAKIASEKAAIAYHMILNIKNQWRFLLGIASSIIVGVIVWVIKSLVEI